MDWFFQQLINGLALGSIYALIALGYTMVYGILRFINFAHSDILMLGAFAAYFLAPTITHIFPLPSYLGALLVTVLAAGICAIIGTQVATQIHFLARITGMPRRISNPDTQPPVRFPRSAATNGIQEKAAICFRLNPRASLRYCGSQKT